MEMSRIDRRRDEITIEITKCDIDPTAGTKGGPKQSRHLLSDSQSELRYNEVHYT